MIKVSDKKTVVLGMSGGVDSSVSAALLQRMGYSVIGVTFKLWQDSINTQHAKEVADKLSIPFYIFDFSDDFREYVIKDFINEYKMGRTPNPCVQCNKHIKFSKLMEIANKFDAQYVATGHYARVLRENNRYLLKTSADEKKDQTYFLYNLKQEELARIIMPLDGISKDKTREIAREIGLTVADKADSQEICFVPDNNHGKFIEQYTGKPLVKGNFIDVNGKILGEHQGIENYTIGQRRWLGIALGKRAFVTKINPLENTVLIGDNEDLFTNELYAKNVNFIPFDKLNAPLLCTAKIRSVAKPTPCTVYPQDDGNVKVVFSHNERGVTCGQSVVFYQNENVLGGGIIYA